MEKMKKMKKLSRDQAPVKIEGNAGVKSMFGRRGGSSDSSVQKKKNEANYKGIAESKDKID